MNACRWIKARWTQAILISCCALTAPAAASAEETTDNANVRVYEKDGVTYRETTQVVPQQFSDMRYEARETTVYREKVTTELRQVQRAYQVPVTEHQWVPYLERSWNPFTPPVMTYRLVPQTRMETRTETVRVPVTNRQTVAEKVTTQVPVITNRTVNNTYIQRVAISAKPSSDPFASTTATARRDVPSTTAGRPSQPNSEGWRPSEQAAGR